MSYTPIFIPLTEGLDQSKAATLGGKQLTVAENVDFIVDGEVRGRPGRGVPDLFLVRDTSPGAGTSPELYPSYQTAMSFANTGFTANGIMSYRDEAGVRPMLGTNGRLFVHEGGEWKDRGPFGCFKVDRLHTLNVHAGNPPGTDTSLTRIATGPDFAQYRMTAGGSNIALLDPDTLAFEQQRTLTNVADGAGAMARAVSGSTYYSAMVYASAAGGGTYNIVFAIRPQGGSVTEVVIDSLGAAPAQDGDAPCICASETKFYVAYQTSTANQYKVKRINTSGTVEATYTGTLAGIHGQWVTCSPDADNRVVVALTNASGLTTKTLNATTMADLATDSTHVPALGSGKEVVVGWESTTRAWWCYRSFGSGVASDGTYIGIVNPASAASATVAQTYHEGYAGSVWFSTTYSTRYRPATQPMLLGGRMYMTMFVGGIPFYSSSEVTEVGYWVTLDLSNMYISGQAGPGPFTRPTLVAQSGADRAVGASSGKYQPEAAVLTLDGDGFLFSERMWNSYRLSYNGALAGETATTAMTKVSFSGPRAVRSGQATILSGSVPHALAGDICREHGFIGRPTIQMRDTTAPSVGPDQTYSIAACWAYMDSAGQLHRSAPSDARALPMDSIFDTFEVFVSNPYMTERPPGEVFIEIYATTGNGEILYLQTTTTEDATYGAKKVTLTAGTLLTTTRPLYTSADEFIHVTPSCDGGIAVLGRRVWVASGGKVFASLLTNPGQGVTWNDEGALEVPLPAGAGRVMALEALDDKLVIFCERGVWLAADGGPNNVGDGPDLAFPVPLTDLGCAGPRSTCVTDRGVVFCSPLDATHPERGGPWLLDRSFSLTDRKFLGQPAYAYLASDTWVPDLGFSYERQQLYITIPAADSSGNSGILVVDFRASKWSTWSHNVTFQGTIQNLEVVDGVLWTLGDDAAAFSEEPGVDEDGGDQENSYRMRIVTSHLASDGKDGLGWSRVRSLSIMEADDAGDHAFKFAATLDQERFLSSSVYNLVAPSATATYASVTIDSSITVTALQPGIEMNGWVIRMVNGGAGWRRAPRVEVDSTTSIVTVTYDRQSGNTHTDAVWSEIVTALENTGLFTVMLLVADGTVTVAAAGNWTLSGGTVSTWPSDRLSPEWRLPVQKCSTIQVELLAYPATARWTAIRLDVAPLPTKAPAQFRK